MRSMIGLSLIILAGAQPLFAQAPSERQREYLNFIKVQREMPKYADIVKNPSGVKVPTKPDAQMLVCYQLAHEIKAKDAAAVVEYVERLPKEFAVTFATTACKKSPMLVAEPAFDKWARQNSSLMAAIALSSKRSA